MRENKNKTAIGGRLLSIKNRVFGETAKKNQYVMYLVTFFVVTTSIVNMITKFLQQPISTVLYICATVGFVITSALWARTIKILINVVLFLFTQRNKFVRFLIKDYRLRTVVITLLGMGINMIFAIFNGVICIKTRSAWYAPLFIYYTALYIMRLVSVVYANQIYSSKKTIENAKQQELNVYRICGIILSIMSIALIGTVLMITKGVGGKYFQKLLIYAVGSYTFLKLILSIKNMVKARKEKSVLLMTLRNIGYSDALVSLLFLQTALVETYGWGSGSLILIINTIIGTIVCMTALILGLHMIWDAKRRGVELKASCN